jgi:AhpD family alkylhydroperoxidase
MHTYRCDKEITMHARMTQPAMVLPDAFRALLALSKSAKGSGVPEQTAYLVHLRASQINGCSYCVEMHARELRRPARATSGSGASRRGARRRTSTTPSAPRWR